MSQKKIGFGITGINDKIGPISGSRVSIDLAYHPCPSMMAYLAIGIKTGMTNLNFDQNIIQTTEANDQGFYF
jgi:hypothetical protein